MHVSQVWCDGESFFCIVLFFEGTKHSRCNEEIWQQHEFPCDQLYRVVFLLRPRAHTYYIHVALYYYSSKAWSTKGTAVQCGCIEAAAGRRCARNNHQFDRRSFEKEKKRKTDINMSRCTYVRTSRHEPIQCVCLQEQHTIVTFFFFWSCYTTLHLAFQCTSSSDTSTC
jgi:hypothetical protein